MKETRRAEAPPSAPPADLETVPGSPRGLLRLIPQVEKLLHLPRVEELAAGASRLEVTGAVRDFLAAVRAEALEGRLSAKDLEARLAEPALVLELERLIAARRRSAYRRVINATGIILHTGLGRAVLSGPALASIAECLRGYSLVEVDVESGERNHREAALADLLRGLTGAESATAVNNNAAATLLILAALARGKEVIVSRGQLVEIGGSFRIPDILRESGARLVEVGTTNRTYLEDYRRAITPETAMLLQVHTSNYEIQGFVHHTPLTELAALAKERGLAVVSDLGSGCFVDLSPHGFRPEPLASEAVAAGADLVCFSGDKLLGGPQAGIIVGRSEHVARARAHPLFRAFRLDKVRLVLLESTLRAYGDPERLAAEVPALRLIREPAAAVHARAAACRDALERAPRVRAEVLRSRAQAGSGSLPAQEIESWAVAVERPGLPAAELARRLRLSEPPVFARLQDGRVLLDFRTVLPGEEEEVAAAIRRATAD
jgi:L-seryl-tRNA(Ser) seleniumtransferase